jgi:hypothetical protein
MPFPSVFGRDEHALQVLRGGERISSAAAGRLVLPGAEPHLLLGGTPVPERLFFRGLTLQGSQGSGKTLTILRLILPVLQKLRRPGNRAKLVVVAVKGDLPSAVLGMVRVVCPGVPVHILNPFDLFGCALDPREFATEPTRILQTIHALTYRKRDSRTDDFFDSSARAYLVELVKTLTRRAPHDWSWRTFFHLATTYDLLERALKNSKTGRRKAEKIVRKTFAGIVSTIESWLDQYEGAFACWDRSPVFSIERFLRGSGVLVLTIPEDQVESLSPVVRLVLRKMKDTLLTDSAPPPEATTMIALDEYADLHGMSEVLYPFYGRSRSSQVSVATAWQSWPAVCAVHDEKTMRGVVDNAAVRVWLGCGPDSAEFASKYCSSAEVRRWDESHAYGREFTRTLAARTELRSHVLAGEFALKPPAPDDLRVRGYLQAAHLPGKVVYFEEDYRPFVDFLNRVPRVKAFRPRPTADHWMEPWNDETDGTVLDALFRKER